MNIECAKKAYEFAKVLARDEQGRPTKVRVPGRGRSNTVIIIRKNGKMTMKCLRDLGMIGNAECPGCRYGTCYHMGAAAQVCASESGQKVIWTPGGWKDAARLANLYNGKRTRIYSHWSGKCVWGIVYKER